MKHFLDIVLGLAYTLFACALILALIERGGGL
jgi:hypothetical protein